MMQDAGTMKSKYFITSGLSIVIAWCVLGGCIFSRSEVIPQIAQGPHGGQVVLINELKPGYVEFVARPIAGNEWLLQIFGYDEDMKPKMHYSSAKVEIITPDEKKTFATLWDTKPYFWNRGVGNLEGKVRIDGNLFKAHVFLKHGSRSSGTHVDFSHPFESAETASENGSKKLIN
jgi:hypothetical protein